MARAHWNEAAHPRDANGRFIEVGQYVTASHGALGGQVTHIEHVKPGAGTHGYTMVHIAEDRQSARRGQGEELRSVPAALTHPLGLLPHEVTIQGVSDKPAEEGWLKALVGRMQGRR